MEKTYKHVLRALLYAERHEGIGHLLVRYVRNADQGYSMGCILSVTGCGPKVVGYVMDAVYHMENKELADWLETKLVKFKKN